MFVVDTDTMTLLQHGHERVTERFRLAGEPVVATVISRIEILAGRFAAVMKAADGNQLRLAQQRLEMSENHLRQVPILAVDAAAAAEFDRLRHHKKLNKIGRADLLIAAMTLAYRATLVSRNLKDFRQAPGLRVENWAD
jgi:tRNA(fMet)-specific endonuclease VapC